MVPSGLIGVVHLPPLPGDPRWRARTGSDSAASGFDAAESWALRDAERLEEGGVDALIVENFGSAPFYKGTAGDRVPPHQVAALARITRALVARSTLPVGVNCLRNDAPAALGIAAATGARFVRVNVHAGAYVTDQGLIEGEAAHTLRYRDQLGADVAIVADVLVKHAAPLAPLSPADAVGDVLRRGLADAVVVTGVATGAPVDADLLAQVGAAAASAPVLIGSGLTPERAGALAPLATGAIVGSWLKEEGRVERAVDVARVRELVAACAGRFRAGAPTREEERR